MCLDRDWTSNLGLRGWRAELLMLWISSLTVLTPAAINFQKSLRACKLMLNSEAWAAPLLLLMLLTFVVNLHVRVLQEQLPTAVLKGTKTYWLHWFHFVTILSVGLALLLAWAGAAGLHHLGGMTPGSEASARRARPHSPPSLQEASPGMFTGPLNSTNSRLWCTGFQDSAGSHWPMQVTWPGPDWKGEEVTSLQENRSGQVPLQTVVNTGWEHIVAVFCSLPHLSLVKVLVFLMWFPQVFIIVG